MAGIFYAHRLKIVLQHTVRDMGVSVTLDDAGAHVSIADNEAVIRETARLMGIKVELKQGENGMLAIFRTYDVFQEKVATWLFRNAKVGMCGRCVILA